MCRGLCGSRSRGELTTLPGVAHSVVPLLTFETDGSLVAPSSKNINALGRCKLPRRTQQPRLSNPGGPLDNDEPTLAAARSVEHRVERRKLRLTLEHDAGNNNPRQFGRHHHLLGHPSRGIRERKVRPRRLSRPLCLGQRYFVG